MKREIRSNYRLILTPDLRDAFPRGDHEAALLQLSDMCAAIRRHVDNVAQVKVEFDTRSVCSFCGYDWEEVTAADLSSHPDDYEGHVLGEPMCCDQAATEFRASLKETAR
ncbi:hypothetical protein [Nonomuraea sp. LPB2021202275-12-8]|uniref:hypothetical protein n=1 Tax=Nonomuraea sp. LPB2021202275-12-8 TaxID=3120159 RepID=UPI00300D7489